MPRCFRAHSAASFARYSSTHSATGSGCTRSLISTHDGHVSALQVGSGPSYPLHARMAAFAQRSGESRWSTRCFSFSRSSLCQADRTLNQRSMRSVGSPRGNVQR
jgi:hypothetical protein